MSNNDPNIYEQIDQPIFFVTPEIWWALGLETLLPNYHIICLQYHPIIEQLKKTCPVFCLEAQFPGLEVAKNTAQILKTSQVQDYIKKNSVSQQPAIMYFKPQPQIDLVCEQLGYLKIGNSSAVSQPWENKIEFYQNYSQNFDLPLMPAQIGQLGSIELEDIYLPAVIQFSRGWAGNSSHMAKDQEEWKRLKNKYAKQFCKITPYTEGQSYTNNICVHNQQVWNSPAAKQINCGSGNKLSTCGRSWPSDLPAALENEIQEETIKIARLMSEQGYQGFFGLDWLVDKSNKLWLIEINPRLTASTSFYTQLEVKQGRLPLLLAHILSFLKPELLEQFVYEPEPVSGTQFLIRNQTGKPVTISNHITTGLYHLNNDQIELDSVGYKLDPIDTMNQILLFAPPKGAIISINSELLRIESLMDLTKDKDFFKMLVQNLGELQNKLSK